MKFKTVKELLEYTAKIDGKTFREIDSKNLLKNTDPKRQKGLLGHIVETGFYNYEINSESKADFENLGIELKVTGYKKNKNGSISAKERLVLGKIDFNKIINETYESSHLLEKCKQMLFIWYLYEPNKDPGDFKITHHQLYDMKDDKYIFKSDFNLIKGKIVDGKAHELSEGDTSYLGACTKARTSKDRTSQPFSDIPSKPRAFSLKNSYMTGILRSSINTEITLDIKQSTLKPDYNLEIDSLHTTLQDKHRFKTVEEYITSKLKPYIGKTQLEILEELTGKTYTEKIPKNLNKMISDRLIGKDKELCEKDELFTKTNYIIKNLPVNGEKALERMSFRTLELSDFEDDWEDSYWKNYFEEVTLITICYEGKSGSKNGYRTLKGVKKITFDDDDLDSFEKTCKLVKKAIEKQDISFLPTPNSFEGQKLEVAPKGVKGDDAYNNFLKQDKTKVTFMLTKKLLNEKLKD
jgi:DNA mismatch repair protein MutH